jgi:predicted acyl esterase
VTGAAQQFGISWTTPVSQIDRRYGAVWGAPAVSRSTSIGGFPFLHTTVVASAKDTSLFAYLYDVGPDGVGALITHKPYSLRDVRPGRATTIDLRLEPIRWNLAAGHHLTLVVDTMDIRYRSTSHMGTTVTFTSPASSPSYFTVPVS